MSQGTLDGVVVDFSRVLAGPALFAALLTAAASYQSTRRTG